MRWILGPCLVLAGAGACSFNPRLAGGDDAPGPDGAADPDGARPDGDVPPTGHVRRLDVAPGKVTGGPHADFPVLVSLTAEWLRETGAGGGVAHADGADLRFTADPEDTVPLAFELEAYDGQTGTLVAWVKVPSLATATAIYLRYGGAASTSTADATAVWSAGYAGVWHLTGDALADSTAHTQATNAGSTAGEGTIARARSFNGANASISVASIAAIDDVFTGGGTAEAWFFATSWGQSSFGRIFDKGSFAFGVNDSSVDGSFLFGRAFSGGAGNWATPEDSVSLNTWTHVVVVYDQSSSANTPAIYLDGAARPVTATTSPSGTTTSDAATALVIGNRPAQGRAFAGRLDELRLSRVARTPGWIATTHENQRAPSTFWIVTPP